MNSLVKLLLNFKHGVTQDGIFTAQQAIVTFGETRIRWTQAISFIVILNSTATIVNLRLLPFIHMQKIVI